MVSEIDLLREDIPRLEKNPGVDRQPIRRGFESAVSCSFS
jgi:hypothetical protein